jgi:D-alanyl-D-alanine carboxypeptidase
VAFAQRFSDPGTPGRRIPSGLLLIPCLLVLLVLAGCAGQYASRGGGGEAYAPTHYYPPPGPPEDPWGPYIREAAARYDLPAQWIRAVMAQESSGEEQAVSPVGAMGLMQLMPATYAELRAENGLGPDPFNPRDNIFAGTAYIRKMYDRYGAPGFLAAYNAGPRRLDYYLAGTEPLPAETVHYVAAISPNLGDALPMSGPLANYAVASASANSAPTPVSFATGCDVNAAYDPDHPCTSQMASLIASTERNPAGGCDPDAAYDPNNPCIPRRSQAPVQQAAIRQPASTYCDPDAAYDPDRPCTPMPVTTASAAPPIMGRFSASGSVATNGSWAIQVGAFSNQTLARTMAEGAIAQVPDALGIATVELPAVTTSGGVVLYRARLANLSKNAASNACAELNARQLPCIVVPAAAA